MSGDFDPPASDRLPPDCLDAVFRTERRRLLRYFHRHGPSRDEAQDLVQEAFLRLSGAKPGAPIRNPGALLQRIARNLLANRSRQVRRWQTLISDCPAHDVEQSSAPDQSHWIEAEHIMDLYRRAVAKMPARTREIFLLHRVDELTYLQIAAQLGISPKAVEYHIASALKHLTKSLDRE